MSAKIVLGIALVAAVAAVAPRVASAQACTPGRLMVVLDKSSSMTGTIAGESKWRIAVAALDAMATEYQETVELGLMMFPAPNQCAPGAVFVEPGLGQRAAMLSELGAPPPSAGNYTPMAQTLEAAAVEPTLQGPGGDPHVVLITDGWQWCSPYDPATRFAPLDAIGALNAAGITTYVVGFGASVDALTLNQMAVEAGTARAGCDPTGDTPGAASPCYFQADDPGELLAALREVAIDVSTETCDGLDNDCDGAVDEELVRDCSTACGTGAEVCVDAGWTGCDAPAPEVEVCDGADNDCDGAIDPGCECLPGDERSCGEDSTVGACQPGVQTCAAGGTWGDCEASVGPGAESCDGADNDCDGRIDESADDVGNLCGPGLLCTGGVCEPLDPVQPPDDEGDPADDDGVTGGPMTGCACNAATGDRGGMLLLALGVALAVRRRR